MKILLTLLLITIVQAQDKPWDIFKQRFHISFNNSRLEQVRQRIFDSNYQKIQQYRKLFHEGRLSFEVDENAYSDVSHDEFVKQKCGTRIDLSHHNITRTPCSSRKRRATLPLSVDWRSKGAVTGVKDQGGCGSCWSFSATGAVEGQTYKKTSKLISLSEQNLIDCSSNTKYGNQACNGGLMDNAFQYIKDNNGVDTEASYAYQEAQSTCRYSATNRGATVTGYVNLPRYDEGQLQSAVANIGPISVAIDASLDTFQFYKSGVYYDSRCSTSNLNHGVLVVGYGTENGSDYWWVKNSWGTGWGINGYVKMARNKNNNCGIASWAVYPTV